jgi:hypothetical protein
MIIDVHRHMVANGTAQGDPIRGAQKTFAMMYRKVHNVEISDRDFREKVVRDGCKKKKMINWFPAPILADSILQNLRTPWLGLIWYQRRLLQTFLKQNLAPQH